MGYLTNSDNHTAYICTNYITDFFSLGVRLSSQVRQLCKKDNFIKKPCCAGKQQRITHR